MVGGQDVAQTPLWELARTVGSVFQNPKSQFFNLDTDSELAFGLENEGRPPEEIRRRVADTVEALHLQELQRRSIFSLSGGQKQRLAVADGCLSGKELLIFDEPTSGLDYGHMLEVSRRLRELAEQGLCVVVITHDGEFLRESGAWTADWLPNDKQP